MRQDSGYVFCNIHNLGTLLAVTIAIVVVTAMARFLSLLFLYGAALGLMLQFTLGCWLLAFYLGVLLEAASGEDLLPTPSITDPWSDLVRPGLLVLATVFLAIAPALAVYLLGAPTGYASLPWLLAVLGLFFWPATILIVAIGDGFGGLRPDIVVRTVVSAFLPYLIIWILLILAFVPTVLVALGAEADLPGLKVLRTSRAGMVLWALLGTAVRTYTMIVSMRLIGLYYRHFKQRFPWQAE
jgi:hypothetical protein